MDDTCLNDISLSSIPNKIREIQSIGRSLRSNKNYEEICMKKYFSIWKGIVSKKSLRELTKLVESIDNWEVKEDENSLDVYTTENMLNKDIGDFIKLKKLDTYTIWNKEK